MLNLTPSRTTRSLTFELDTRAGRCAARLQLPATSRPRSAGASQVEANRRWLAEMGICRPGSRDLQALDAARFEELAWLVCGGEDPAALLLITQLLTAVFLFDDEVDGLAVGGDPAVTRRVCEAVLSALSGSPWAEDLLPLHARQPRLVALLRGFGDIGRRVSCVAGDRGPWLSAVAGWLDGVVAESRARCGAAVDLPEFMGLRLRAGGILPFFELVCLLRGWQLHGGLRRDPDLVRARQAAALAMAFVNDLFSLGKEEREGEGANLVLVVERVERLGRVAAIRRACALHDAQVTAFLGARDRLLTRHADRELRAFLTFMESCFQANLEWFCSVTRRYEPLPNSGLRLAS